MNLATLQDQFSDALFYRNENVIDQIKKTPSMQAVERLQVYRNSFIMGTTEALAMTYKYTLELVGEEFFNAISRHFILNHPPSENNIMTYGFGFDEFLKALPQLKEMPYVSEMASFEWLLEQTSNSPLRSQELDISLLSLVEEDTFNRLKFTVPSDVSLFCSNQDIHLLYEMIVNNAVTETDLNKKCYIALKKHADFRIELINLEKDQFLLLQQLTEEKRLEQLVPYDLHLQLPALLEKSLLNGFTSN